MSDINQEIKEAISSLTQAGIDTSQLDAELLMAYALHTTRIYIISHPNQLPSDEEIQQFRQMIARRTKREPLAYITGEREFWKLSFDIVPGVLVPRPETEILVETVLSQLRGLDSPIMAEIGAGSGCIAISLAMEVPDAFIYATEDDPVALEVAGRNALKHRVSERVKIMEGNLLDPLQFDLHCKLDAVISNPPYIPSGEIDSLQPEVAKYEPRGALDGGPDGMVYHRRILDAAREWLKPGGWVHMEIGIGQAAEVVDYAYKHGYWKARITKDLAGIERIISCKYRESI